MFSKTDGAVSELVFIHWLRKANTKDEIWQAQQTITGNKNIEHAKTLYLIGRDPVKLGA